MSPCPDLVPSRKPVNVLITRGRERTAPRRQSPVTLPPPGPSALPKYDTDVVYRHPVTLVPCSGSAPGNWKPHGSTELAMCSGFRDGWWRGPWRTASQLLDGTLTRPVRRRSRGYRPSSVLTGEGGLRQALDSVSDITGRVASLSEGPPHRAADRVGATGGGGLMRRRVRPAASVVGGERRRDEEIAEA